MNRKERRRLAKRAPVEAGAAPDPGRQTAEARRLQQAGDVAGAARIYREVLARAADHYPARLGLGTALRRLGDPAAIECFRRALRLRPDDFDGLVNLANALQEQGQSGEARAVSDRLLAAHPTRADAWSIRVGLKTFTAGDPDLAQMESLLARLADRPGQPPEEEIILTFALGRAWMDAGDAERAFAHLSRANRLQRATLRYDGRAETQRLASIPGGLRSLAQLVVGPGAASELPVFVVGMPRSGTTLVEQILASHPAIQGAGELSAFPEAMTEAFQAAGLAPRDGRMGAVRLDPAARFDPAALGQAYLRRVEPLAAGKARLVDKLPGNFASVGLISLALPQARVIHCRRDPLDTCLSCYAIRFVDGQPFAYDLAELGQYYRTYAALMDEWRRMLPPERFLEVRYEDVLADLEGQARRMVAFCGLDWDPACLRFHETRRAVRTASVNQVRRPLYASSQGRWRAYRAQLAPLIEALGDAAPPDRAPAG